MATHQIPRNVKGESRILYIFTGKSLIYTVVAGIIGIIMNSCFYSLFINEQLVRLFIIIVHAAIGFGIANFKIPDGSDNKLTRKVGGEYIDKIIIKAIKFKLKGKRVYIYTKEEMK